MTQLSESTDLSWHLALEQALGGGPGENTDSVADVCSPSRSFHLIRNSSSATSATGLYHPV